MMKALRKIPFLILLLPLVAAILLWHHFRPQHDIATDSSSVWQAQITSIPQPKNKSVRAEAVLLWRKDSLQIKTCNHKVLLYIHRDSLSEQLRQGDSLLVYGSITHSNRGNPYEFDYDSWLRSQGIEGIMFVREGQWMQTGGAKLYTFKAVAERCRQWFVDMLIRSGLSGRELAVVAAMTVGERDELDSETRRIYSDAGAAHVLAVSGLHTGIVYGAVLLLLTCFGAYPLLYRQRVRRWTVTIISLLCIWCYAFLTGLSPSVMRAALMITIFAMGATLYRQGFNMNTLFAAAFLNLLFRPEALFSVSFQLSYSAVAGILLFYQRINKILCFRWKSLRWLWNMLCVSVAAQLGTIPVTLWYFQQTSNWFALTNLFVIPLATVIIYLSIALVMLFNVPYLGTLCAILLKYSAFALNKYVAFIDNLPCSNSNLSITVPMLVLLVIAVLLLAAYMYRTRWYYVAMLVSVLIAVSILHIVHIRSISSTQQTIVYNTYPYTLVLQQQGRQCTLYTDSVQAAVNISEPLRKQMMIRDSNMQISDFSGKEIAAFTCADKKVLLLKPAKGHRVRFKNYVDTDIVLIGGRGKVVQDDIDNFTSATNVIALSKQHEAVILSN